MNSIIIWGAGGHAKVVAQSIRRAGVWQVEGHLDDQDPGRAGEAFCGSRVLGGREMLASLQRRGIEAMVLAFGHNFARLALWRELAALGWQFPSVVDAHAVVADDVRIGAGSYLAAGAVVQPGAHIGAQVIVNTAASVDHDGQIGDGVHLAPRCCLAGHVTVGRGTFIGAGSVVRDRVRIGAGSTIGAGSLVLADLPDDVVAFGHPARVTAGGGR
ncbi:MAG: acetyltransferase [Caldimonas sp.]